MKLNRIDHLVLTVSNPEITCEFYYRVFGMQQVTFGDGCQALQIGEQKINLHQVGKQFEPKALNPTLGSADICFVTTLSMTEVKNRISTCGIDMGEVRITRTGAMGAIGSIHPNSDGNLIEVSNYS